MNIQTRKFYDPTPGEGGGTEQKEIKTSADLLKELGEIKAGLELKAKEDAKAEVTEQLKAITTSIEEVKNMKPEVTAEELKKVKSDLDVTIKAFDKLQIILKDRKAPIKEGKKSFDDVLKESIESKMDDIAKFNKKEIKKFDIEIDMKAVADMGTGNITGTTNWGAQRRNDIIMNPNTMTHVRDLLTVSPAGPGTDYYFMREEGNGEGAPAAVAEGALKSQFDLDLVEASVKFETIAGFLVTSRKSMLNIPGFLGFLQKRVPQKLMDAEDAQVLYGNGTSPNIKGILTAGNFVAGSAAGATPLVEKIITDISNFEDTYKRLATGIAMRPKDYFSFFLNKASGSGEYDLPQGVMFVNGILYILGVPVAKTTALTSGDYVVGDFQNGADLLIQEAIRLEFFEQDSDNVRKNKVTIRVEETIALPVYGDDYFMKGSSDTSAS
jgi:hypothetical protein